LKKESKGKSGDFLHQRIFVVLFTSLSPFMFLIAQNYFVYNLLQIISSVVLVALFSILLFFLFRFFWLVAVKKSIVRARVTNLFFAKAETYPLIFSSCLFILALFLYIYTVYINVHEVNSLGMLSVLLLMSFAFGLIISSLRIKLLNLIAAFFFFMSLVRTVYGLSTESFTGHREYDADNITQGKELTEFKHKPNVYFFLLESIHSENYIKEVYKSNIDSFSSFLAEKEFVFYDSVYANYFYTAMSALSVFHMKHHYYAPSRGLGDMSREAALTIGDNPVLRTFKHNDYKTAFLDNAYLSYLYRSESNLVDYTNMSFSKMDLLMPLFNIKVWLYPIVKKVYYGIPSLRAATHKFAGTKAEQVAKKTDAPVIESLNAIKKPAKNEEKLKGFRTSIDESRFEEPTFRFIYGFGADHADLSWSKVSSAEIRQQYADFWEGRYHSFLKKMTAELIDAINYIDSTDPDALIILMGDHGTVLKRTLIAGSSLSKTEREPILSDIDNEFNFALTDLNSDAADIFCAVKWPVNIKPPKQPKTLSPVNIFRYVFSVLSADSSLMNNAPPDNSYFYVKENSYYMSVENGKPLREWKLLVKQK